MSVQTTSPKTSITNQHFVGIWHAANSKSIQNNPRDQSALYLQVGLNELLNYSNSNGVVELALQKRKEIFDYFYQAGKHGDPRGMFFEGLCFLEGFGCKEDVDTGRAFIQVAAVGRKCDLALNYLNRILGLEYLYGTKRPQSFAAAIKSFQLSGEIATPELHMVGAHLQKMQLRLQQIQSMKKVVVLEQPSTNVVALRM